MRIVDEHIGRRLRARRLQMDLTQESLADQLGLAVRRIQKYESGVTGITAGTLVRISEVLYVRPDYFFEGLPDPDWDVYGDHPTPASHQSPRPR